MCYDCCLQRPCRGLAFMGGETGSPFSRGSTLSYLTRMAKPFAGVNDTIFLKEKQAPKGVVYIPFADLMGQPKTN